MKKQGIARVMKQNGNIKCVYTTTGILINCNRFEIHNGCFNMYIDKQIVANFFVDEYDIAITEN